MLNGFGRLTVSTLCAAVVFATGAGAQERTRLSADMLTPAERDYLTAKGEVTFCVDPDWMPFEAIHDGQLDGMTSDFQQLFSQRLGVPFRFVPTTSWAQSQDWAKAGTCDILPMIPITQKSQHNLTFSEPYLSYSVGIIAADKLPFISGLADLANHPVGIVKGYSTWEYVKDNFPNNQFVEVEGIEDGLLKVSSGKISAFLIAVPVAVHNIKELGLSNLNVAGHIQIKKELRIGVSRNSPQLMPIIEKLVASLNDEDVDAVYRKWVAVEVKDPPNYDLIVMIATVLFLVLAIVVWWNRKLSRLNKEVMQRESELQAAKDQAEQYLHIAGTVIVALDEYARVQLINKAGCQLIGLDEKNIIGRNWIKNFIPSDQRNIVARTFAKIMRGEITPVEHFENEIIDANGNVHLISWHNTLIKRNGGEIVGALSSGEDITEARKSELDVLAAKNAAEQADRAKTKFLAAASHDLRQPAQAMNLFIHALKQAEEDDNKLAMLAHLEESSQNLSALLNSLLDISRLDAGAVKVEKKPFKLNQVFSSLLEEYETPAHDHELKLDCVPCSLTINSDQTLISIILRNLIGNAFAHSKTKRILLGCRRKPDGVVEVQVWDTGVGIHEEHMGQIFNEFYQIDNEARHREKGLGLGLAIVKRVCDLLDVKLTIRSEPGRGTMFALTLPVVTDEEKMPDKANTSIEDLGVSGLSIVIVEDEEMVRKALALVLEKSGNRVLQLADMVSADSIAQINGLSPVPDIIVADYRLANGDTGVEAIHSIRRLLEVDVPAFLLTGDTAPERIQEALQSGFPLVHKPVHPQDLFGQINRSLETS